MNRETLRSFQQHIQSRFAWFWGKRRGPVPPEYKYIRLTSEEFESEAYKRHLGGGKEQWEKRGRFQLHFLKSMGMLPSASFLDIGCGPLRAGVHLIGYLDPGHYSGFDYNADFIKAAEAIIETQGLTVKRPKVTCISDFDCSGQNWSADFALAFSVLNHCSEHQKALFFERIPEALRTGARLYITHAAWLRPRHLKSSGLEITQTIGSTFMDITLHGWDHRDDIFPVIELTKAAPPNTQHIFRPRHDHHASLGCECSIAPTHGLSI